MSVLYKDLMRTAM